MVVEDNRAAAAGCAICLDPISGEAYLDQCFHVFCYHCILQWSEMVLARPQRSTSSRFHCLKCPLCKTHYTSIIHDFSGAKFQRHHILTSRGTRFVRSEAHIQRQAVYNGESGNSEQPSSTNVVPKPNRWLFCWVQRELQALMQEEDVETVTQHVVGIVEAFSDRVGRQAWILARQGAKAKDLNWHTTISTALQPFIFELAEKFAGELRSFLVSGLDIAAYDRHSQLVASPVKDLNHIKKENIEFSLNEVSNKTYDLYDEDVEGVEVHLMVRRPSTEVESLSSEDIPKHMERHNCVDDSHVQGCGHQRRESTHERHKKKPVRHSDYNDEDSDRGRSRYRREGKKKRKLSTVSISPPRVHRKKHRTSKSQKGKGRKSTRKSDRKLSHGNTCKGHSLHRKRRKLSESSSARSSETDSSGSSRSRSRSRGKRAMTEKAIKESLTSAKKTISRKSDSNRNRAQQVDDKHTYRVSRYQDESSYGHSHKALENAETTQFSEDHSISPRRLLPLTHLATQCLKIGNYSADDNDRSLTSVHTSDLKAQDVFSSSKSPVTPEKMVLESTRLSSVPVDAGSTPRGPSPDKQLHPASRGDDDNEEGKTLETKLREQALANLKMHLNQKKDSGPSPRVVQRTLSSANASEDVDVSSPQIIGHVNSPQLTNPVIEKMVSVATEQIAEEIWNGPESSALKNSKRVTMSVEPVQVTEGTSTSNINYSRFNEELHLSMNLLGKSCRAMSSRDLKGTIEGRSSASNLLNLGVPKSGEVIRENDEAVTGLTKPNEQISLKEKRVSALENKMLKDGSQVSLKSIISTSVYDVNYHQVDVSVDGVPSRGGDREKRRKLIRNFKSSELQESPSCQVADDRVEHIVPQSPVGIFQASSSPKSFQENVERISMDISLQQSTMIDRLGCINMPTSHSQQLSSSDGLSHQDKLSAASEDCEGLIVPLQGIRQVNIVHSSGSSPNRDNSTDESDRIDLSIEKAVSSVSDLPSSRDGNGGVEPEKYQQKSMSVMRGGELVQVSYKVYIPPRAAAKAAAARRRLQR